MRRCPFPHLGIVGREGFIENANVFMVSQRHAVRVQEPRGRVSFFPDKVITPEVTVRHHKLRSKHPLCKKHNGTIVLDDALILRPQFVKWDYLVPLAVLVVSVEDSIGEVADYAIYALVIYLGHPDQTVLIVYLVNLYHFLMYKDSKTMAWRSLPMVRLNDEFPLFRYRCSVQTSSGTSAVLSS